MAFEFMEWYGLMDACDPRKANDNDARLIRESGLRALGEWLARHHSQWNYECDAVVRLNTGFAGALAAPSEYVSIARDQFNLAINAK